MEHSVYNSMVKQEDEVDNLGLDPIDRKGYPQYHLLVEADARFGNSLERAG